MISTSKADIEEDAGFELMKMFPKGANGMIATDGCGADEESDESFEFDVQPDDIYDLTVF
jgi:hypothetical protein